MLRTLYPRIKEKLEPGKVLVLYGPRRSGKTFLLKKLAEEWGDQEKILTLNGESAEVQTQLSVHVPERLSQYLGDTTLLIVDEAQKIPEVGQSLKMLVDTLPHLKVIASGSASFELAQKVGEPLTGRKKTLRLFPISAQEIIDQFNVPHLYSSLEEYLVYGSYPELFSLSSQQAKIDYLRDLTDSYLLRDILELEDIRNSKKIRSLLEMLALQMGQEVSHNELGNALNLHHQTVERYLDLLEKSFVLINIRGFSRNLRKEITKTSRYYFYDNGLRNILIRNMNPLHLRSDAGMLWENWLVTERLKAQSYSGLLVGNYFWRTYDQQEIDWVEDRGGDLYGYEMKWGMKRSKKPAAWGKAYPEAGFKGVTRENFLEFLKEGL